MLRMFFSGEIIGFLISIMDDIKGLLLTKLVLFNLCEFNIYWL